MLQVYASWPWPPFPASSCSGAAALGAAALPDSGEPPWIAREALLPATALHRMLHSG